MRFLVVCGFDVTIAIFCPTTRLSSVDLPAFGRPTIAANPDRGGIAVLSFSFFPKSSAFWRACLLDDRQLQRTRMLGIVQQRNVRGPRVFPRFRRNHSPAIVVLFDLNRVDAAHYEPQTAALGNPPREKREIAK